MTSKYAIHATSNFGQTLNKPYELWGCQIRAGSALLGIFARPKTAARPAQLRKKHCPCILEGRLITNPILSALHFQGSKSYIYVHFH